MSASSIRFSGVRLPLELGHATCTLEAAERAARIILRDSRDISEAIEERLTALRDHESRTRALMTVAPLPCTFK